MARADIYIRKHNEKRWAAIKNKSEWVNKMIELKAQSKESIK